MRKGLALLLAGMMLTSTLLTGCGGKDAQTAGTPAGGANAAGEAAGAAGGDGKLAGEITFWHSFTQGARLDVIQETADQFMMTTRM